MFVSQPMDGVIYVARRRERGGRLLGLARRCW